jgi:nitroreductase
MEKSADTNFPINELIQNRWSPRAFSDETVDEETLCSLFEAARWAPSCYNDQPWFFVVGRRDEDAEVYEDLLDCLVEENQSWAKNAPVLALSVARTQFDFNGKPNRHALHDVGLAVENLVIEAMDRGLYVHQMAGFVEAKARTKFNIPEECEPVAGMAIGYPGDPSQLPEDKREQEEAKRERKPLDSMVFGESWNRASDILSS